MQAMDLRRAQGAHTVSAVRLREAIKGHLTPEKGIEWLAGQLGKSGTTVLRWVEGPTAISLAHVVEIEDVLNLDRGALLRAAGYVSPGDATLEQLVDSDPRFRPEQRTALRQVIHDMAAVASDALLPEIRTIESAPTRAAARKRPRR